MNVSIIGGIINKGRKRGSFEMMKHLPLLLCCGLLAVWETGFAQGAGTFDSDTAAIRAILDANGFDADAAFDELLAFDTAQGRVTRLDMSTLDLDVLPADIGDLSQLRVLLLFGDSLTELPPEISNLAYLAELDLTFNNLTELPPEIGDLDSLVILRLPGNELISLPENMADMAALKELDLADNQFEGFPVEVVVDEDFPLAQSLQKLVLAGNLISSIPSEIGYFQALRYLQVQNNAITEIAPEIGQLSSLTSLMLNGNALEDLPIEITDLTPNLGLNISGNRLCQVADTIAQWIAEYAVFDQNIYDSWTETQDCSHVAIREPVMAPAPATVRISFHLEGNTLIIKMPGVHDAHTRAQFTLYSVTGTMVRQLKTTGSSGVVLWDLDGLPRGIYYLRASHARQFWSSRVIIP